MKKVNIFYWIVTILFALAMLFTAYPNIMASEQSSEVFKMLGYPLYMQQFIGIAKVLGVICILIPGFLRLKEWAYAGLVYDLVGATYSIVAMGTPFSQWWSMLIFFVLAFGSYFLYHKKSKTVV